MVYGAPFRPPRMPFVIFVVSLLAAGLVGLLLLNTELQRGTFQVTALNQQADQLRDQQEQLEKQVRTLESPQNLADRALRMGMVPNPNPVFLRLSDGQVLGVPAEGKAGTGTAMFGPGTPTGRDQAAGGPKPPVSQPKPPATKPPAGKPRRARRPRSRADRPRPEPPAAGDTTTKPATRQHQAARDTRRPGNDDAGTDRGTRHHDRPGDDRMTDRRGSEPPRRAWR